MKVFEKAGFLLLVGLVCMTHGLFANDDPGIKLGRGLTNIVASPGEYYVQTSKISSDRDPMTRLFAGFLKGTCAMVERIGVGLYDVLTFPVPLPAGYQPVIQPPTVMDGIKQQYSKSEQDDH